MSISEKRTSDHLKIHQSFLGDFSSFLCVRAPFGIANINLQAATMAAA
jgi:hypothetical protein